MELDDPVVFKEIYKYSYDFAKVKHNCACVTQVFYIYARDIGSYNSGKCCISIKSIFYHNIYDKSDYDKSNYCTALGMKFPVVCISSWVLNSSVDFIVVFTSR